MPLTGLFELQTPADLFHKMEHDCARIQTNRRDTYAAFDFFITANCMIDWVHPGDMPKQKQLRDSDPLLQICSQLANGSKHFQATRPQHKSVDDTHVRGGAFSSGFSSGFDRGRLEVDLKGDAAMALGNTVEVTDLAGRVLELWRGKLGL